MLSREIESAIVRILGGAPARRALELEELCRVHPDAADAIRARAAELQRAATAVPPAAPTEGLLERIGPYRILDVLGEGGMGTVYLAEQQQPVRRRVALKLIKLGMDSRTVVARFEQERQALALMQHDGIAKVFDCGTSERGQPYFVMEYVKGTPLTEYCERSRTSLPDRIGLMQQVCAAVTHAHQKGVVHRDLKPSNVLVSEDQGRLQIKIIDFGLAKAMGRPLVEATLFTEMGQVVGTPEYMAPEQADPTNADIDTRADIYSLGVMLYELLVSALPFSRQELRRAGMLEVQRILREVEPPRPSTRLSSLGESSSAVAEARRTSVGALQQALRTDLDWLVMKALEKDRARRYDTANALSADLQRFLDHEPLVAGPPSAGYRLRKLLRRHRGQVLAAGAVLVTAVAGAVVAIGYAWRADALAGDLAVKVGEFDQLSVAARHRRAIVQEARLYPAWPQQSQTMEDWLRDCGRLLQMRGDIEKTVQTLRERALPATEDELRRDRESHPRFLEWQRLGQRIRSLRDAQAVRAGAAAPAVAVLTDAQRALPAQALNMLAWVRVAPPEERQIHGEEAFALTCARLAVDKGRGTKDECWFLDTLAWALLANGQDAEAKAASDEFVAKAPAGEKETCENDRRALVRASDQAGAIVAAAESEQAVLAAEVAARRTFRFAPGDAAAGFLYDTLADLLHELMTLEQKEMAGVRQRLEWSRRIGELSRNHPNARVTWADARNAIGGSEHYRAQSIELREQDVVGLVPIGMNPATGLWEFYDLRSAWDGAADPATIAIPEHRPDGSIEITDETGIVLVLLPGGTFMMGSQNGDPDGPNYSADTRDNETVHPVTLAPFLFGKYELTQGQWVRLWTWDDSLRQPSYHKDGVTLAHPVEQVDWNMSSLLLARHGMVLPTEAQWEYGCRAGKPTPWWPGTEANDLDGVANVLDQSGAGKAQTMEGAEAFDDRHVVHAPVGTYAPNEFGLYDVHGNVWEWCRDTYGIYGSERLGDGMRPEIGENRIFRGGSFKHPACYARSAKRSLFPPSSRSEYIGVRCARPVRLPD